MDFTSFLLYKVPMQLKKRILRVALQSLQKTFMSLECIKFIWRLAQQTMFKTETAAKSSRLQMYRTAHNKDNFI